MIVVGLDIGTTGLCALAYDTPSKSILTTKILANPGILAGSSQAPHHFCQDPESIWQGCQSLIESVAHHVGQIDAIGISGQMHGILYLDEAGVPLSPLYTWQDQSGELPWPEADSDTPLTYSQKLSQLTGYPMSTGYGLTTHFYLQNSGQVPPLSHRISTIMDYVAMRLCSKNQPLIHSSNAAALGLYCIDQGKFDQEALTQAKISSKLLPPVKTRPEILGKTKEGWPVVLALGDNQAGVLGSLCDEKGILINIGTSSQVSFFTQDQSLLPNQQAAQHRPYFGSKSLWVSSCLCGGYAYQMLKDFFLQSASLFYPSTGKPPQEVYSIMDAAASAAQNLPGLEIDTRFFGTRQNPHLRGSIEQLGPDNFTPGAFALGVLRGMVQELYQNYKQMAGDELKHSYLIGSGNAITHSPLLQNLISTAFELPLRLAKHTEGAAFGAALHAYSTVKSLPAEIVKDHIPYTYLSTPFTQKIASKPIFFQRNRVRRVYQGGKQFHDFFGDEDKDNHYPEEWIASTVRALNKDSQNPLEGMSLIKDTAIPFADLLAAESTALLGEETSFPLLVKLLDSGIRLPLQTHPHKDFSQRYLHSPFGKTEMWLILSTRPEARLYFGFREKISKAAFTKAIEESRENKSVMTSLVNEITPKPGEVYLIPARAVHAIGYGCLLLEVQEPTDFTIQPEYWCGDYLLQPEEMYLGLDPEIALECFDFELTGKESLQKAKRSPQVVFQSRGILLENLISAKDTPCFSCQRLSLTHSSYLLEAAPAVYVVLEGQGKLLSPDKDFSPIAIKKGDYFFLPATLRQRCELRTTEKLLVAICLPPGKKLAI